MFYRHLDKFIVKILTMHIVAKTFEIYFLAKITTKIPPTLENKNVPILRSQNTQNTRTPLKTGTGLYPPR